MTCSGKKDINRCLFLVKLIENHYVKCYIYLPYEIIIEAKHNFFSILHTNLDVEHITA